MAKAGLWADTDAEERKRGERTGLWNGQREYTNLTFDPDFYRRFRNYEYILLCHLDSFVFRDELEKWCQTGYDYIGSLIYNTEWEGLPTGLGKVCQD